MDLLWLPRPPWDDERRNWSQPLFASHSSSGYLHARVVSLAALGMRQAICVHFAELDSMVFLLKSEIRIVNSHEILVHIAKTNTEYGCSEAPIHVLHQLDIYWSWSFWAFLSPCFHSNCTALLPWWTMDTQKKKERLTHTRNLLFCCVVFVSLGGWWCLAQSSINWDVNLPPSTSFCFVGGTYSISHDFFLL